MDDLIVFLRQQLDEDERVARAAEGTELAPWLTLFEAALAADDQPEDVRRAIGRHIANFTQGRMLWDIAAKRRIVDAAESQELYEPREAYVHVLQLLAVGYAGREGYQPEWAPS